MTTTPSFEVFYEGDATTLAEWAGAIPHYDNTPPCLWGNGKPGWFQWALDHKGRPCEPYGPFDTEDEALASAQRGDAAP